MNFHLFWNDDKLIWEALTLSLAAHLLLFRAGALTLGYHEKHTVEIDITNMGHIGMPGGGRRAAPSQPKAKPAAPPKEWMKPAPIQKVVPAPIPTQAVPAPAPEELPVPSGPVGNGTGEVGIGTGEGGESTLSRIPQLLNLSDLGTILKRYYPEEARSEHKEGTVVLDLHIDTEGHVKSVDIVQSGGVLFDAAAEQVAKLLRFTPAFAGSQRVAVKMRQPIQFKLED